MRLLKALGALALLLALVVGVPFLLFAWGSPMALLSVDWANAWRVPDDGTITLGLLSLVGWVAWLAIALTTAGELIVTITRGAVRPRIPATGWLRPAVGALVTAALAPLLTWGATTGNTPAPEATVVAAAPLAPTLERALEPLTVAEDRAAPAGPSHLVEPGDELWTVAERYLGNGERWREIVAANPGLSAESHLTPGTRLHLPAGTLPEAPAEQDHAVASAGPSASHTITVRAGDTLWALAQEHLGDPERWPEIFAANRSIIADPDEIDVGWTLVIPSMEIADSKPPADSVAYPDVAQPAEPEPVVANSVLHPTLESGLEPSAPPITPSSTTTAEPTEPAQPETDARADADPESAEPSGDDAGTTAPGEVGSEHTAGRPPAPLPARAPAEPATPATTLAPTQPVPVELRPSLTAQDPAGREVLGPMGALLAAGVVAGVATRRRAQLLQRAIGRSVVPASPEARRFWTALTRHSEDSPESAELDPTSVVLGWRDTDAVHHALETARCTVIDAEPELAAAATGAVLTSLLCAPWSAPVEVVAVEPQEHWAVALDDPRLSTPATLDEALEDLQRLCARRRIELGSRRLLDLRADEDLADAWQPVVFVFCQPLAAARLLQLADSLSLGEVGVSVLASASEGPSDLPHSRLRIQAMDRATLDGSAAFRPQLITAPARRAIVDLFSSATTDDTEPAPWWTDPLPANVTPLRSQATPSEDAAMPDLSPASDGPVLHLLGPVELTGCRGPAPTRAIGQCMEYCAWLLENPGSTPTQMTRDLLVAEGTRRSNMSRLRTWLGADDDRTFLPDAYSGTIALDDAVTSDWESFQLLLSAGVNRSSSAMLKEALALVRGEPLEGYAFQWGWAAHLRTDMVSMITDAAAVLADRAIIDDDLETAQWAIAQGRLAADADEVLRSREIHVLALLGDTRGRDEAVRQLTRAARAAGQDLQPETVRRIHIALNVPAPAARRGAQLP